MIGRSGRRALLYAAPAATMATVWVYGPLLVTVVLSFFDWNLTTRPPVFVGVDNYRQLVASDDLHQAVVTTIVSIVAMLVAAVLAPLAVAVLVWRRARRTTALYRTLFFVPVVIPPAVGSVIWEWLLHPVFGVTNWALGLAGTGPVNWLNQPRTALAAVLAVTAWKAFGLSFILFSAGLTMIDRTLIEAARTDGATSRQVTRFVVVPLLRPTTVVVVFTAIVFAAQWSFTAIDVLTGGGPAGATTNVFYLQYRYAFDYADGGGAAALATMLVVAFGTVSVLQLRAGRASR